MTYLPDTEAVEINDLEDVATSAASGELCVGTGADACLYRLLVESDISNLVHPPGHGDGGNCAAGEIPLGVDAAGAVEGCYEPVEADITDLSHTADTIGGDDLTCAAGTCDVDNRFVRNYEGDTMLGVLTLDGLQLGDGEEINWTDAGSKFFHNGRFKFEDDILLIDSSPSVDFDDTTRASNGNPEVRFQTQSSAAFHGSWWLAVMDGGDDTLIAPFAIVTVSSAALTKIGDCTHPAGSAQPSCTNFIQVTTAGIMTGEGTATIEADALAGAIPTGVTAVTQSVDDDTTEIATTAFVQGELAVDIVTSVGDTDTVAAAELRGTMHIADHATSTSDVVYTLPTAVAGYSACFYDNGGGDGGISIDINGSDTFLLNGTALDAGDQIDSPGVAGAGANGDYICLVAIDATNWITLDQSGTWVDGG